MPKLGFLGDTTIEEKLDFIAVLETARDDFSHADLKNMCRGKHFLWSCTTPRGRSGGILMGLNLDTYDTGTISHGDFYLKFKLKNRDDGYNHGCLWCCTR